LLYGPAALGLVLIALVAFGEQRASFLQAASGVLVAQIVDPIPHRKLNQGEKLSVRIRVEGVGDVRWSLVLRSEEKAAIDLAAGSGVVRGAVVADVNSVDLDGGKYILVLVASIGDLSVTAEVTFDVSKPSYALIPSIEGNLSRSAYATYASDSEGDLLLLSGPLADPEEIVLLERMTGLRKSLSVNISSSEGVALSGDGRRMYFAGFFGPTFTSGLGFLDLSNRKPSLIASNGTERYSLDAGGRLVAYEGLASDRSQQYFLYDEIKGETRQLTDDPRAIVFSLDPTFCPQRGATKPLVSADGSKILVITNATLGMLPEDETVGCRVFCYNLGDRTWRHVGSLPSSTVLSGPALSMDGRWLSFISSHRSSEGSSAVVPAVIDIETGGLRDPLVDVGRYTSFDAVITGDGRGVVISTQADLDPRVGNADHNMELFYFDLTADSFTQITETTGGIGRRPGGCDSYQPTVSRTGNVVTFLFKRFSVERCRLDGPQRNEGDGFVFSFVRAVRIRPGNRRPELEPPGYQRVAAGELLTLAFTATDPDGDPISFFAQVKGGDDVPPGSEITDHHDGTATFRWPTRPENAGEWVLRVAAFDEGGGEVFHDVAISVVGEGPPLPSLTPTATATPTSLATTLSPSPGSVRCPGDCNRDRTVGLDELVKAIQIALGKGSMVQCPGLACGDGTDRVTIECLVQAVGSAMSGCS
jgi:hypothetical protein